MRNHEGSRWSVDSAIFKSFAIKERVRLRVQADFFNVFNVQGNSPSAGSDGTVLTYTSYNTPRVMQLSARLTW